MVVVDLLGGGALVLVTGGWSGVVVTGSVGDSVVVGFSDRVVVSGSVGGGAEVGCGVLVEVVDVMTTVLVGLGQGGWVGNDPGQLDVTEIQD